MVHFNVGDKWSPTVNWVEQEYSTVFDKCPYPVNWVDTVHIGLLAERAGFEPAEGY